MTRMTKLIQGLCRKKETSHEKKLKATLKCDLVLFMVQKPLKTAAALHLS